MFSAKRVTETLSFLAFIAGVSACGGDDSAGSEGKATGDGGTSSTGGSVGSGGSAGSGGSSPMGGAGGGTSCPDGQQDTNGNGSCELACEGTGQSDALNCGDNGTCAIDDVGVRGCTCDAGYAGETCETCATGYQDEDGDSKCELGCDATGSDELDCGDNGTCEVDASGARGCVCASGYEGDACDVCAEGYEPWGDECVVSLPVTTQLSLWLDASISASIDVSGTSVTGWLDRRMGNSTPQLTQSVLGSRPGYLPTGKAGRGVVRFDGLDDVLYVKDFWGLSTDDYEIVMAVQPLAGTTPNGLASLSANDTTWAVLLDQHVEGDYRLTHRVPSGASGGNMVVADRTSALVPGWVVATHQSSGGASDSEPLTTTTEAVDPSK